MDLATFLTEYFRGCYWIAADAPPPPFVRTPATPAELWSRDPEQLLRDIDEARFGEYTADPAWDGVDAAAAVPWVPERDAGGILGAVAEEMVNAHHETHLLAGIDYWYWLATHPAESPASLKDERQYYFFGSLLRGSDGYWNIPSIRWDGDEWSTDSTFLTQVFAAYNAALLVERPT